jgi:hypothetical protein
MVVVSGFFYRVWGYWRLALALSQGQSEGVDEK